MLMRGQTKRIGCVLLSVLMMSMCSACGDEDEAIIHTIVDVNEVTQEYTESDGYKETASDGVALTLEGEDIPISTQEETEEIETAKVTTITISAVGDVTMGTHQDQDYYYSFRQVYDQAEDEGYFF